MVIKSPVRRELMPSIDLVVKLGFLAWMLGITFLYWLIHPGSKLVGSSLGRCESLPFCHLGC